MQTTDHPQHINSSHDGPVPSWQRPESSASQTAAAAESHVSGNGPLSSHAQQLDAAFAQTPPAITSSHALATHFPTPADNSSQSNLIQGQDMSQQRWQAEQNVQPGTANASAVSQEASRLQMAADHFEVEETTAAQPEHDSPSVALQPSLLIESNVELVRARSNMLDIPSAELLDSILDYANTVCAEQHNEEMEHPCEVRPRYPLLSTYTCLSSTGVICLMPLPAVRGPQASRGTACMMIICLSASTKAFQQLGTIEAKKPSIWHFDCDFLWCGLCRRGRQELQCGATAHQGLSLSHPSIGLQLSAACPEHPWSAQ